MGSSVHSPNEYFQLEFHVSLGVAAIAMTRLVCTKSMFLWPRLSRHSASHFLTPTVTDDAIVLHRHGAPHTQAVTALKRERE